MEIPRKRLELRDDPGVLSPPMLTLPLYACAKCVNITGYVPDATLDVEINGAVLLAGVPGGLPAPFGATIGLPAPLVAADQVRARQRHAGATSAWSPVATVRDHTADYPAGLPRPELFPTPLYTCGVRTGVGNLIVGCDVRITANNVTVGAVAGANNPQGVNVTPASCGPPRSFSHRTFRRGRRASTWGWRTATGPSRGSTSTTSAGSPFDRRAFDAKTKSMLSTYRFPGSCFAARRLRLSDVRALHLGLNRADGRPIAFDDLEIVQL